MRTFSEERKRHRVLKRTILICVVMFGIISATGITALADSEESILKTLESYDIDSISNILLNGLRIVGFGIVKGLATATDAAYTAIIQVYKMIPFAYSGDISRLMGKFAILYKIVFLVAFTVFGIKLMLTRNADRFNTINCIICIVLVISAMPLCMEKMGKLTYNASNYAIEQWNDGYAQDAEKDTKNKKKVGSIATSVISSNLVDLRRVDSNIKGDNLPGKLKKDKPYVSSNISWKRIDINEYMDYNDGDMKLKNESLWEHKLTYDDKGKATKTKIKGWTKYTSDYYYRWQVLSWFAMIMELLCIVVVLFFVTIRAGRVIIDLAMAMIYTPFVAVTDLSTGQRIKETIKDIIAHFAALFLIVAILSVYFVAITYIEGRSINSIAKIAMHIAVLWAVIDGPNIIERIAGIDMGYNGVWKTMLVGRAAVDGVRGAGHIAAGTAKFAGKAAGKTVNLAGTVIAGKEGLANARAAAGEAGDSVSDSVREATGGRGLFGFARNAAEAAGDHIAGEHSSEGLERASARANSEKDANGNPDARTAMPNVHDTGNTDPLKKDGIHNTESVISRKNPGESGNAGINTGREKKSVSPITGKPQATGSRTVESKSNPYVDKHISNREIRTGPANAKVLERGTKNTDGKAEYKNGSNDSAKLGKQ